MLLNTLTGSQASLPAPNRPMPLCTSDTLATIGVEVDELVALFDAATAFVHTVVAAR